MKNRNQCNDCLYYLPIDVMSGLCKKSKKEITPNQSEACFVENKKCKYCRNFKYTKEATDMGTCKDIHLAYPEMVAVTCNDFERNTLN